MTTDTVGGIWTYSLTLCRELNRHGVKTYLATMGAPTPAQRREAMEIGNVQLFESRYRLEWMDDPWDDVRRAREWLLSIERRVAPDLVHLNSYALAAADWSTPVLVVGHSCVLSWWRAVKGEDAPASWDRYRTEVRGGLVAADIVIAPSRAMLQALKDFYGVADGRVIPNACDPDVFVPAAKEPLIFSAGRLWDEAKNIRLLDQIASQLSWPVYIAGESRHPSGHETELQGARVLGRLSPELAHCWCARASIYALPAKYEPFGLSVLEAALSGCALVLGDIPSLRENWDGVAVFVDPNDSDALRHAIEMLIADDEHRIELARRARQRGTAFSPERMSASYMRAYSELISTRQMHSCA